MTAMLCQTKVHIISRVVDIWKSLYVNNHGKCSFFKCCDLLFPSSSKYICFQTFSFGLVTKNQHISNVGIWEIPMGIFPNFKIIWIIMMVVKVAVFTFMLFVLHYSKGLLLHLIMYYTTMAIHIYNLHIMKFVLFTITAAISTVVYCSRLYRFHTFNSYWITHLRQSTLVSLPPDCMGLCLSTDSYTNLFQRSPLWWATQILESQTIKVGHGRHISKHRNNAEDLCFYLSYFQCKT